MNLTKEQADLMIDMIIDLGLFRIHDKEENYAGIDEQGLCEDESSLLNELLKTKNI